MIKMVCASIGWQITKLFPFWLYCESTCTVRGPRADSPAALQVVSGESSLIACQVEDLATKTTEGADLVVKECVENIIMGCLEIAKLDLIKMNIKLAGFILLF